MGTSKGGTAALYYGLKNSVNQIVIGACQYRIGSYVAAFPDIFKGMTSHEVNAKDVDEMDRIMPKMLRLAMKDSTTIHLIHSSSEPTYERDIKYLIKDLNESGVRWTEYECGFENHEEIGKHFIPIAKNILSKSIS